jgi:2-C-methyl-D-erythritol 4-phosphate cytidylyltransferase/2-C-methyl-D-erythritol 2,4-cyclodiphosphate synthase
VPKQYRDLAGKPVLFHSISALLAAPQISAVCVVIHPDHRAEYDRTAALIADHRLLLPAIGGTERAGSVCAGLNALSELRPEKVLIHDGARPFVSTRTIANVIDALQDNVAAIAAVPVVDSLRRSEKSFCGDSVSREGLWRAQTPQGFRFQDILAAHHANSDPKASDDAEVARQQGIAVKLVEGSTENFKITTSDDLARAERQMRMMQETRIGQGYDVHAFTEGDAVILCGIEIPHDRRLSGHSDADVAMHALTDALFGALAEGDIGRWFPPSDPQWKGANSAIFLEKAMERLKARGGSLVNCDLTIICERPKITPHADRMIARLADVMQVEASRVSVKATTSERLGFTGREEGIAAMASVSIVLPT